MARQHRQLHLLLDDAEKLRRYSQFKQNIEGDQPEVPDGMSDSFDLIPLEFFMNPRCMLAPISIEATIAEAEQSETTEKEKEQEMSSHAKDFTISL